REVQGIRIWKVSSWRTGQRQCRNRRLESWGEERRSRSADVSGRMGLAVSEDGDAIRSGGEVGDNTRLGPCGWGVRIETRTKYASNRDRSETTNGEISENDIRAAEKGGAMSSVMRNAE